MSRNIAIDIENSPQPLPISGNELRFSQMAVREKRREERLKKIKERQFDEQTLHVLFRLFDRDKNSHVLSVRDFQTGLVAMGFEDARDMTVVGKIVSEIDTDRSGDIREDEFIAYFARRRLEDLEKRLQEVAKEGTSTEIRVIDYGVLESEYKDSGILQMGNSDDINTFRSLLRNFSSDTDGWSAPPRRWFDMNGFHQSSMMLFSQCYGLHEETMKDAGIFQRQKMEVLTPGPGASRGRYATGAPGLPFSASLSRLHSLQSQHGELKENKVDSNPSRSAGGYARASTGGKNVHHFPSDTSIAQPNVTPPDGPRRSVSAPESLGEADDDEVKDAPLPVPVLQRQVISDGTARGMRRQSTSGAVSYTPGQSAHCTIVVHALYCDPPLELCVWKPAAGGSARRELSAAPDPTLYRSQYTIFSINNNVVLTVRKNHSREEDWSPSHSSTSTRVQSSTGDEHTLSGSGGMDFGNGIADRTDRDHSMWNDLRERIRCADADVRVNSSSAKYIAFSALEVVMEHNYKLRDTLRKWLQDLEDAIQRSAESSHTVHLYEFSKLASAYVDELRAIGVCLEDICPRSGGIGNNNPKILSTHPSSSLAPSEGLDGAFRGFDNEGNSLLAEDTSLGAFFDNEYIFFKDLADEVQTICFEVDQMISTVRSLKEYYRSVQDDRMNKTLYVLTLVTSVFVPAQFFTGLYGMNFSVMPELNWKYGYYVWWVVVIFSTILVSLWVQKMRVSVVGGGGLQELILRDRR